MPQEARVPNPDAIADATAVSGSALREALRIRPFRRLWTALGLSSLGDWLGLLATTSMATSLTTSYRSHLYATGGVLALRMLPALLFGPFAGAFADRFDRRWLMVGCDVMRALIIGSIPIVGTLPWLLGASFVIEVFSLFWIPAKEASVPNIVPRERLEAANQLSLVTTYGMAPVAAAIFAVLSVVTRALATHLTFFRANPVDLALWFDAATFLFSAATIVKLVEISRFGRARRGEGGQSASLLHSIADGWAFAGATPMVRGLVLGIVGAFAAGGAVVGVGRVFAIDLGGGEAGYGVLFGAVFVGLAGGMLLGPRALRTFSRRRLFGVSIVLAGTTLCADAVLPNLVLAVIATTAVGAFAGVAWVTGYTLLGGEVEDAVRGRTFSLVQSLVQVDLLVVLATAPFLAGLIGGHHFEILGFSVRYDGVTIMLFVAGLLALSAGLVAFRQMDDRHGVPVLGDLWASIRGTRLRLPASAGGGLFLAFEGGEGAGKSTQVRLLAEWLGEQGQEVLVTHEPGGTAAGQRIRALLLDPHTHGLSARAEALLYAADRAAHVDGVIVPALDRGAVIVTDRYVDSSLAYQGAGRALDDDEVAELQQWATGGLRPDLTILLDVPPEIGLHRATREATDRIEAESLEFHSRVRQAFLNLARRHPERYLVLDAGAAPELIAMAIRERVSPLLPVRREAVTSR